ncbi:MAG: FAD-dependent oxidoreductase [Chloroflexota bacterium]|nr:FAD-dependent oxidoreductase [Chloroflexota bacterium]
MKNNILPYDLVIIGGGSAGLTAAGFACQFGARVAIVEVNRIGGDCTWTGCVPSKTLLKAARVAHEMRTADRYGLQSVEPQIDLKAIMAHVHAVVQEIYREESPEALRAEGIDVFLGAARFLDPHTLAAGEITLKARNFLIATGAHPLTPPIEGIEDVDYLTYEDIWDLEVLPRHLMVLGAGPVGCEMAQAFRRLGAGVTLIERLDRVLPRDDPAASQVLSQAFIDEGIDIHCGMKIERAWQDGDGIHLSAGEEELVGDTLLVAVGRRPNVAGLGLENAGVTYSADGIHVDDYLRTSQRHIYAAGDCTGGDQFTHYAGWQAVMAARNALLPGASRGVTDHVPWATFTDPEVAQAGLTEAQARDQFSDDVEICQWQMEKVDRARTEGDEGGFMKLVYKKDGTLLGVTIVAGRAGEMIHEWIVALESGMKAGDLSNALHIYPTYATASMQAAAAIRVDQLLNGMSGRIIHSLARVLR